MGSCPFDADLRDVQNLLPKLRKLLLHGREIAGITRATDEKGITLVPLRVYFKDGRCKVELALARGKARYDKRQAIAARDAKRDTDRDLKEMGRAR